LCEDVNWHEDHLVLRFRGLKNLKEDEVVEKMVYPLADPNLSNSCPFRTFKKFWYLPKLVEWRDKQSMVFAFTSPTTGNKVKGVTISSFCKKIMVAMGIDKEFSAHSMRQ
jgi:hypothetical protein